jgi:pyruvate kinase
LGIGIANQKEELEEFEILGRQLNEIYINTIEDAQKAQSKFQFKINETENICSRDNLLCYLALRKYDLSHLQVRLAEQGLSSLEMLESHVLVSIERVLKHFGIVPSTNTNILCRINSQMGSSILAKRSELLFGSAGKGGRRIRRTHIMVTLDSSDIFQYELIEQLLENGLDIARINCAHNTKREWKLLIESIRSAEERLVQRISSSSNRGGEGGTGRKCIILMDLAGPKIRTGPMELKVRPLKISVPKDMHGRPVRFVEGFLDSEASHTELLVNLEGAPSSSFVIAISKIHQGGLGSLKIGQKITFRDARDDERLRTMTVLERISPTKVRIGLEHTAYLKEGIKLECQTNNIDDAGGGGKCSFTVGPIKAQPIAIEVQAGNTLLLYKDNTRLGHSGATSDDGGGGGNRPAGISCSHPDVIDQVMVGHRVFIDDGKIEAIVRSSNKEYLETEIVSPIGMIAEIKSNKGINFPDSSIRMPALTPEDIENLDFVVKYADLVGLSFVHRPEDIHDLHKELSKLNRADLGIVAKIETADSIHNLAKILIAGLELPKFAILIARGDLAVEVGFENLAFVQEDILCLCEAAHIPAILGTQILESLAESGLRSRPEIIDAIMGQRAECVMLNNGTHIVEAVKTLAGLLSTEERHQIKKRQLFTDFTIQNDVFEDRISTDNK